MQLYDAIFVVAVVMFSAVIHEVMHGVAADRLGDRTARYAGRLTLNPIPHLDMWGSILIPIMLALANSPLFFGWAKPVPYNPYNLRPGRFSEAIVAFAGPLSNLVLAIAVAFIIHLQIVPQATGILFTVVAVNCMLFLFNLIPIPPLDGSKVIHPFLPRSLAPAYDAWRTRLEMNPLLGMTLVIVIILVLGDAFGGLVLRFAELLVGA